MWSSLSYQFNDNESIYKRIRISVSSIYKDKTLSDSLEKYIMNSSGIRYSKGNPVTGRILIIFDENLINEEIIKSRINTFLKKNNSKYSNIIKFERKNFSEETALPIALDEYKTSLYFEGHSESTIIYALSSSEVENLFNTNIHLGLSKADVHKKLSEIGLNTLSEKKRKSLLKEFLENINELSTKFLISVGIISILLGQIIDGISVLSIIALESVFGTIQQHKAEASLYSLKDMMVHKAKVIRDGRLSEIDAKYLVPGDIIIVEAGDKIPADARIVESIDLMTTESSLTGESIPISKKTEPCSYDTELGNRHNMLYMGTNVVFGRGKAIVVATGMNTEIGKIAAMIQNIKVETTPLQNRVNRFTAKMTRFCLGLCFAIISFGVISGRSFAQMLTISVGFSIGALPESLPAVVTIAMALSVQRLTKKNAIIRKLTAIESLGNANVICCDKTGTLTMNEMTAKKAYFSNGIYNITGSGYNIEGSIDLIEGEPSPKESLKLLFKAAILCNNAILNNNNGKWTVNGDPTEGALLTAACKLNMNIEDIRQENKRIREIPFDSSKRSMTVVTLEKNKKYAYLKGSTNVVIEHCKWIYENGEERLFTLSDKEKIQNICNEMADEALRVLALAYKKVNKSSNITNNFVFLGLIGMEDPPKKEVKNAIEKCHRAGIKIIMITGDNKNTAAAIGRQLGLLTDGIILSGSELDGISDIELTKKIKSVQIFARTSPEQKYRIVKALKKNGYIVAMTGDGVNDAPAIREADVGIAMGGNGSDIAKDVASITLVDDNFSTIILAIEEGRTVSNNIRNSLRYLLSGSFGEILAIFLTAVFCGTLPFLSIQLLWLNVIAETLLGSSLAVQEPTPDVMDSMPSVPVTKNSTLIDKTLKKEIASRAVGIGLSSFGIFGGSLLLGYTIPHARSLAYTNLVLTHITTLYDCSNKNSITKNNYMNTVSFTSMLLLLSMIYIPTFSSFFGLVPLSILDWAIIGAATSSSRI